MIRSFARNTSENAPSSCSRASRSALGKRALARPGHQVQHDFGIAGGLENGPVALEIAPQFRRIRDVAVVRHRDLSLIAGHRKRLRIQQHRIAGGGIARVPDGQFAGQLVQHSGREDIGDMTHLADTVDGAAVAGRNPSAFLSPMLKSVQAEIGEIGGFGMAVNGENATLFVEFVEVKVRHQATADRCMEEVIPDCFPKLA